MSFRARLLLLVGSASLVGCDAILGLGDYKEGPPTSTGGSGGATSTSGPTMTTSSSGDTTTTTTTTGTMSSSASGMGGSGGAMACTPNEVVPCPYLGTPGTEGHGHCAAGTMTCKTDGSGFEACIGQIVDMPENCTTGDDEDCDDVINNGCTCMPNQSVSCYSGPGGTDMTGICHRGNAICNAQGTALGPCMGEQTPLVEDCGTTADENCNGAEMVAPGIDTLAGCECLGASTQTCYSGPSGTQGIGKCKSGTKICNAGHYPTNCPGEVVPVAEVCTLATGDEDCDGFSCSEINWSVFGGDQTTQGSVHVATDPMGNVYWIGSFNGTITIGGTNLISAGNTDIFVAKFSATGTLSWAKRFGTAAADTAMGIASDGVSVAVIASTGTDWGGGVKTGSSFAKLSASNGAFVWQHACTGPAAAGGNGGIAFDNAKNILVSVSTTTQMTCEGGVALGHGATDLVLAKYSSAGAHLWSKSIAGTVSSLTMTSGGIVGDAVGSIWVTGSANGAFNFGCFGGPLSTQSEDVFIAKLASDGTCTQQMRFGSTGSDAAFAIALDALGGPAVAGYFANTINFGTGALTPQAGTTDEFIVKLGSAGNVVWSRAIGVQSATTLGAMGITADGNGDVIATGSFFGASNFGSGSITPPSGNNDAFVAKYRGANGVFMWVDTFSGLGNENGLGVAAGAQNRIYATGTFRSTPSTFGGMNVSTAGGDDVYLVAIDP